MATTTKVKAVRFITTYPGLRIPMEKAFWKTNNQGQVYDQFAGRHIVFGDGLSTDPHEFTTTKDEEIEFLRNHPDNGTRFIEEGADEPRPTFAEVNASILQAVAARDEDRLLEIENAEKESHNRPAVFDALESAVQSLDEAPKAGAEEGSSSTSQRSAKK